MFSETFWSYLEQHKSNLTIDFGTAKGHGSIVPLSGTAQKYIAPNTTNCRWWVG